MSDATTAGRKREPEYVDALIFSAPHAWHTHPSGDWRLRRRDDIQVRATEIRATNPLDVAHGPWHVPYLALHYARPAQTMPKSVSQLQHIFTSTNPTHKQEHKQSVIYPMLNHRVLLLLLLLTCSAQRSLAHR